MKKLLLSAVTIFTLVSVTNAQGFHGGIKAGANLSKIDGTAFKNGFELGYQVGGFLQIDFTKQIGIQPELLWSQTNTTVTDEPLSGLKSGDKIHLNYLSVPVLLRINASKLLTINVGPQFSILTNTHETVYENAKDAFKSGDFAMVAGAQINLGSLKLYGRYNVGLNNISDVGDQGSWKNQQFQFGVGLKLF